MPSDNVSRSEAKEAITELVLDLLNPPVTEPWRRKIAAAIDALPAAGEDDQPGSPLARLTGICNFAVEHCGHCEWAAKPAELTLMEWVLDAKTRLSAPAPAERAKE